MDRFSKGITDFRKRLYWGEFKQLKTVVPPIEEQTANLTVNFNVPVFADAPWQTNFQLVRIDEQWKIKSFTDLTRRPIKPGAMKTYKHKCSPTKQSSASF